MGALFNNRLCFSLFLSLALNVCRPGSVVHAVDISHQLLNDSVDAIKSHILDYDNIPASTTDLREILKTKFEQWTQKFEKEYASEEEMLHRFEVWIENHVTIERHNRQDPAPSFLMGHNSFTDLTGIEFREMFHLGEFSNRAMFDTSSSVGGDSSWEKVRNGVKLWPLFPALTTTHKSDKDITMTAQEQQEESPLVLKDNLPDNVNWVTAGAVTSVKNQHSCGSCWSFSAAGAIEGLMFLRTDTNTNLSVQELIDCSTGGQNDGCNGGTVEEAFRFIKGHGGLCPWNEYVYVDKQIGVCEIQVRNCTQVQGSQVSRFISVKQSNNAMMKAIAQQPVAVAIEANQESIQHYKSGVYNAALCETNIDHAVLAVGYGTENGEDYYLVKNSWGSTYGENGYIKIGRTGGANEEQGGSCGILKQSSYPEYDQYQDMLEGVAMAFKLMGAIGGSFVSMVVYVVVVLGSFVGTVFYNPGSK